MTKPKLTEADYARAAAALRCDVPAVKAVCEVEAPRGGFLPDGQVTILFERHVFSKRTGRRFDIKHPDISSPKPGGYGAAGPFQHQRLAKAVALDRGAALESASWGKFQIMGFNHEQAGFPRLQDFVNAMHESEGRQLDAFVSFVLNGRNRHPQTDRTLAEALREHDWSSFAYLYNGAGYEANEYDDKLSDAWRRWSRK